MEQKTIAAGLVSLVVGFALGNVTGGSDVDIKQIDALISEKMAPANDAVAGLASSLSDQFSAVGDRLGKLEEQMVAAADTSALDDLGARLDSMAVDLKTSIADGQSAMAERMSNLGAQIGSAATMATETVSDAAQSVAEAATGASAAPEGGISAGQTAVLADGAVRAFVSMVGDDSARISVNGTMATLAAGGTTTAGDCTVTLNAVGGGMASLSATCDDAKAAAPDSAPAAAATQAPENGTSAGETALLGDGAARVFVSMVTADSARIAVNGLDLQTVSMGDSIAVGEDGCTITVDAIGGGQVGLGYGCDS